MPVLRCQLRISHAPGSGRLVPSCQEKGQAPGILVFKEDPIAGLGENFPAGGTRARGVYPCHAALADRRQEVIRYVRQARSLLLVRSVFPLELPDEELRDLEASARYYQDQHGVDIRQTFVQTVNEVAS